MATAQASFDDIFRAIERLDTRQVERILSRLLALQAQQRAPNLPARETELMQRINQGLPVAKSARYHELMAKRRLGTLPAEDYGELLGLTDESERLQAERIQYLAELARLRGTPLRALMDELGLQPAAND
jgi:hypothetical protein